MSYLLHLFECKGQRVVLANLKGLSWCSSSAKNAEKPNGYGKLDVVVDRHIIQTFVPIDL